MVYILHGDYDIFLIMGNAGFISSTVWVHVFRVLLQRPWLIPVVGFGWRLLTVRTPQYDLWKNRAKKAFAHGQSNTKLKPLNSKSPKLKPLNP